MYSEKRTLFGTFIFFLIAIVSLVLFAFSISDALEGEIVEPANPEEAVIEEGTAEEVLPADPVPAEPITADPAPVDPVPNAEPLTVLKNGSAATAADYSWDEGTSTYSIKSSDLTFVGKGDTPTCSIKMADDSITIDNITFVNVKISSSSGVGTVSLKCNLNLTITINGNCSFANTGSYAGNVALDIRSVNENGSLEIKGDNSSFLSAASGSYTIWDTGQFDTTKITGGIGLDCVSTGSSMSALDTLSKNLVFDTDGYIKMVDTSSYGRAIIGSKSSFKMIVNKGIIELHGDDYGVPVAAINSSNSTPESILSLADGVTIVGATSSGATREQCKEGVNMKFYEGEDVDWSYSCIDDDPAATIFIISPAPEPTPDPTPGGGASETAQTGDSIPAGAIALIGLIALGSFVALRSRKSTF